MQNTRLITLLNLLNSKELVEFGRFMASPIFNERQPPQRLLQSLEAYHPEYDFADLTKEGLYDLVYQGETYTDIKLRQLMSYTTKKLEEYLAWKNYNTTKLSKEQHLLEELKNRGADKAFEHTYKINQKELSNDPLQNSDRLYIDFALSGINHSHQERVAQKRSRQVGVDFGKVSDALDKYYLAEKFKLYANLLNFRNIKSGEQEVMLMGQLMGIAQQEEFKSTPAISLYRQIILTIAESEKEQHFDELKKQLAEHALLFPQPEARLMYGMAQNYCIKKINTGQSAYVAELFEIYRSLLETEIILENGQLSPWDFKNIVTVGLRLNEAQWTQQFITNYLSYIDEPFQENAHTFNQAKLYFHVRKFEEVLPLLQQVEYHDLFYNLDAKATLMKTYYELDEHDALLTFLDTFKTYIRRQKQLSPYHKKAYNLLIGTVKKLTSLPPGNKDRWRVLDKEIAEAPQLPDREWLKAKLQELV